MIVESVKLALVCVLYLKTDDDKYISHVRNCQSQNLVSDSNRAWIFLDKKDG